MRRRRILDAVRHVSLVVLLAWAAVVVIGNAFVDDALKESPLWAEVVLCAAYAGVAVMTRPRVDEEIAMASRAEKSLRIFLASAFTWFAIAALAYAAVDSFRPPRTGDHHPTMPIGAALVALVVGAAASTTTAIALRRAGPRAVLVTRLVLAGCAVTAAVFAGLHR